MEYPLLYPLDYKKLNEHPKAIVRIAKIAFSFT
jgi:hypothetical protein